MSADDRPPELDALLDHLVEVMPPMTPEEEARIEVWNARMKVRSELGRRIDHVLGIASAEDQVTFLAELDEVLRAWEVSMECARDPEWRRQIEQSLAAPTGDFGEVERPSETS